MSEPTDPARLVVSWDDMDLLIAELADRLVGERFDLMLAITRGGLVPAGMLAYRLRIRNILVAAVEFYDDHGQPGPRPTFLQFPADPLLRGQRVLVVDEVWDSGTTIQGRRPPDDRGSPLETGALRRPRSPRRACGHDRRVGGVSVQVRRLRSSDNRSRRRIRG